jgi:photosystem II stability/assembly factor-like uncharacterized protein
MFTRIAVGEDIFMSFNQPLACSGIVFRGKAGSLISSDDGGTSFAEVLPLA